MTNTQAMRDVQAMGLTCRYSFGEFRINYKGGREATAYYTSCPHDAVATARHMQRERLEQWA